MKGGTGHCTACPGHHTLRPPSYALHLKAWIRTLLFHEAFGKPQWSAALFFHFLPPKRVQASESARMLIQRHLFPMAFFNFALLLLKIRCGCNRVLFLKRALNVCGISPPHRGLWSEATPAKEYRFGLTEEMTLKAGPCQSSVSYSTGCRAAD